MKTRPPAEKPQLKASVLLMLHDYLDEERAELTSSEMASRYQPSAMQVDVERFLLELVGQGFVVRCNVGPPARYRISRAGILEVERTHRVVTTRDPITDIVHSSYTAIEPNAIKSDVMFETQTKKVDWTKWGTILAGIGIFVAVAVAVIH